MPVLLSRSGSRGGGEPKAKRPIRPVATGATPPQGTGEGRNALAPTSVTLAGGWL